MSRVQEQMVQEIGKKYGEMEWSLDQAGRALPPGTERKDAARNRRKIVETARRLFSERGVTQVSMEEISRAAGVGKGTLYRRFPNKGLLCQALMDEPTREFQEETLRILGDARRGPLEKLDLFLDGLVRFTDENLDLLYGGNEPLCGADRLARFEHPAFDWRRWTVLGLLRAAAREGDLNETLDLEYLAAALLAPLDVDFFYFQRRVREMTTKRISAGLRSLVPT
ncbi:MAG TPA: helix-turn-helix domain-containing protein [Rubrobacteraceae bacterium]|nr:helix-turn-helix domain-containing protein [Rubrobacteraceae bacterium]